MLWPRPQNKGVVSGLNYIRAYATYIVPPNPGKFEFDDDVGKEFFYVAVNSDPKTPSRSTRLENSQFPTNEGTNIAASGRQKGNISVRGIDDLVGRGVVFDPGLEDADPHVYFSTTAEDEETIAVVKFQLRHEKMESRK
jgi:hypothetical protein